MDGVGLEFRGPGREGEEWRGEGMNTWPGMLKVSKVSKVESGRDEMTRVILKYRPLFTVYSDGEDTRDTALNSTMTIAQVLSPSHFSLCYSA